MNDELTGIEWISAKERFTPPKPRTLIIDPEVSKIVGYTIYTEDPRLIKLIVKWKKEDNKSEKSNRPDNYLQDLKRIKELKEALSGSL